MLRNLALLTSAVATFCFAASARAADYPSHPIALVVAFPPGGPSDLLARIVGGELAQILHQPVVIENRPGDSGNTAAEHVAHAAADGYTLLMGNNAILATNASLFRNLKYDAVRDFAPISMVGTQPNILVVTPGLPAQSVAELIALAKREPGRLNYGNSGFGGAAHLSAELFKHEAQVDLVGINYKGAAPALQDVIAGRVQVMFATSASVMGDIRAGLVRPLAVTTAKRVSLLPDLPTVAETLPGFDAASWHGLVGPAGTPNDVIETLHRATVAALADPATRQRLADLGVEVVGDAPAAFAAHIQREIPKWAAVIKASGATIE